MKQTICQTCGKPFLQEIQGTHHYCRICSNVWRKKQEQKREQLRIIEENRKWQEQRKRNQEIYENEILKYDRIPIESINPSNRTLYIIGNGFDLMHRVPSNYYAFRDSLGKNNNLRRMLESALTPDDIWADFENSLGKMNFDSMGSRFIVDSCLEDSGFYDEDSGAAEFYMAVETAAYPIISIVDKLQPAFRRWVSTLCVATDDKPLKNLFCPEGKVLNFNYTEFIETLYGAKNVCYIHGCRKNKKEKLILGHKPGLEGVLHEKDKKPRTYRQSVVSVAQKNVFDLITQYDVDITKNSQEIIQNHRMFFESLSYIDQVVVIGHSLSHIDWDYFFEIKRIAPEASWYFGIFGLTDLMNLEQLVGELEIKHLLVFRTDEISTVPNKEANVERKTNIEHVPKLKLFKNENTVVTVNRGYDLTVDNDFELVLPSHVRSVLFLNNYIFIILNDLESNIILLSKQEEKWQYKTNLKNPRNQNIINRRLKHVYLTEKVITFGYNNRVRRFNLETGEMITNQQVRDAKSRTFEGIDIVDKFILHT